MKGSTTPLLLLLLVYISGSSINVVVNAFVFRSAPSSSSLARTSRSKPKTFSFLSTPSTTTTTSRLEPLPSNALGDVATSSSLLDNPVVLGVTAAVMVLAPLVLAAAANTEGDIDSIKNDDELFKNEGRDEVLASSRRPSRRLRDSMMSNQPQQQRGGVGRRGTLATLVGGALSFAASDMFLGTATGGLGGGGVVGASGAASSSVYGIQWNGLFQRVASAVSKHEGAVASPELLHFIAKSPAALASPKLRAWIAAQRAFQKSRQLFGVAAAGMEADGLATAAVAAAAVAVKNKKDTTESDDDTIKKETTSDVSDTVMLAAEGDPAETTTENASLNKDEKDLLFAVETPSSTDTTMESSTFSSVEENEVPEKKEE